MTSHYKVLRQVTPSDLDTHPRFVKVLKAIPPDGYVTFERFRHIEKDRASHGISHACSVGILERISPHERVLKLDTVQFWLTQLNDSGHKNTTSSRGTKPLYIAMIAKFDEWLRGRSFQSRGTPTSDRSPDWDGMESFGNVEELLEYCEDIRHQRSNTAKRVMREYAASPQMAGGSTASYVIARCALKSYFGVHDVSLELPKAKKNRTEPIQDDDSFMTLEDFYKMLQNGKPNIMMRTIMLILLQSGMDISTFTDRFNYEGYSQIVKHFKTADHAAWNLDTCPVQIKLVRVKTDVLYTTFIDHDAVVQLQEYLTWKEVKCGRHDASKPLFLTTQGTYIRSLWLSINFSRLAVRAGIQKKVSQHGFKITAHKLRHLLKSTLLASGCAQYAADHVLGHSPRDAYEKQCLLYPEDLRSEYAKASSRLNIISKVESNLNSQKDPESQEARIRELEAEVAALRQSKAGEDFIDEKRKNVTNGMNEKINRLLRLFDALPDDIKEKMPDELDG